MSGPAPQVAALAENETPSLTSPSGRGRETFRGWLALRLIQCHRGASLERAFDPNVMGGSIMQLPEEDLEALKAHFEEGHE
jgi:hypothetical protein